MPLRELLEAKLLRTRNAGRRAELEAELRMPPFPRALDYLWRIFNRMRRRKGGGGFGPQPIEWADFEAFQRLAGVVLQRWEIEILEDLDDLFIAGAK